MLASGPLPASCEDAAGPPFVVQGQLRLHGSNTVGAKLAPDLASAYARQAGLTAIKIEENADPDIHTLSMQAAESAQQLKVEIEAHGTATAFPALADGKADIGMASRKVNDKERKLLTDAGMGDPAAQGNEHVLSLDGVLIVVHPDNPIGSLTLDQLHDLFTGKASNWAAVGGPDRPVTIYSRDSKSGTFDTFKSTVMKGDKLLANVKLFQSNEDLADAVASDTGAIGFVGFAYGRNAKPLSLKLACALTVPPEQFLVRTEEYPLARRLYLYTSDKRPPLADNFIRFALSPAAQPIVEAAAFINLVPHLGDARGTQARLSMLGHGVAAADAARAQTDEQAFRQAADGAVRLSTTFRFEHDKADLDARARDDLARVAAWIKAPENKGRQVFLVGHTSGVGSYGYNVVLSRRRAAEVAARLSSIGAAAGQVIGVGSVSPVGCDDKETRGALNRRVEVWVR